MKKIYMNRRSEIEDLIESYQLEVPDIDPKTLKELEYRAKEYFKSKRNLKKKR